MKHVRHVDTGLSCKMDFNERPNGTAVIDIIYCGEYASAIVSGPALEFAREAYARKDIQGFIDLWRLNCGLAERMAA